MYILSRFFTWLIGYRANKYPESLSLKKNSHNSDVILGLQNQIELAPLQVIKPENLISEQEAKIECHNVNISIDKDPDFSYCHKNEENPPNLFEKVTIEDCFEYETLADV